MKNSLAPISKIPSDLFALIPDYLDDDDDLITMTHVCRGWRELLIARPSLWVRLDCTNTDETRVYIERSKSAPLELSLYDPVDAGYLEEAFLLVVPHIGRLKSLSLDGGGDNFLQGLTPYFSRPIPLLNELIIDVNWELSPVISNELFNGNLSSLCSLSLSGVTTHLPWRNLLNLTTFKLSHTPEEKTSITQLLDFLKDAHHLRDIEFTYSTPSSSDASPGRVLSLPHLEKLNIKVDRVHSILLNHLSIPAGALLALTSGFTDDEALVAEFLPKTLENFGNIFPISSVSEPTSPTGLLNRC